MKVSKPILIALGLAILFAGYMVLSTGRKQPGPGSSAITNPHAANPVTMQSAPTPPVDKPHPSLMNLTWRTDPFLLPKSVTDKKTERRKVASKLTAIMEGRHGRYAIIGSEIVKKGDMVGDERVADIGSNTVVLVRDRARRTLSMEETLQ